MAQYLTIKISTDNPAIEPAEFREVEFKMRVDTIDRSVFSNNVLVDLTSGLLNFPVAHPTVEMLNKFRSFHLDMSAQKQKLRKLGVDLQMFETDGRWNGLDAVIYLISRRTALDAAKAWIKQGEAFLAKPLFESKRRKNPHKAFVSAMQRHVKEIRALNPHAKKRATKKEQKPEAAPLEQQPTSPPPSLPQ